MSLTLAIVAPVFGIILVGYLAGRTGLLAVGARQGISDFAFKIAIPVLLARTVATAQLASSAPLAVWISYFAAVLLTWVTASVVVQMVLRRPAADGAPIAMAATFGNNVMLGLPLAIATFGEAAKVPVAIILSVHAPILWLAATMHASATTGDTSRPTRDIVLETGNQLARNPIIIGIAIGFAWSLTGLAIPGPVDRMMVLLAQAGIPVALVALGLSLVGFEVRGQVGTVSTILALKLAMMPLIAWVLGAKVFDLDPTALGVVVIMAAAPTGANAYLFAQKQDRAVASASGAIAVGTIIGVLTTAVAIAIVAPAQ